MILLHNYCIINTADKMEISELIIISTPFQNKIRFLAQIINKKTVNGYLHD